jgi:hypothetical protein
VIFYRYYARIPQLSDINLRQAPYQVDYFLLHPTLFFVFLFFVALPLSPSYASLRLALVSCSCLSRGCCSSGFTRSSFSSLSNSQIGVQRRGRHCRLVTSLPSNSFLLLFPWNTHLDKRHKSQPHHHRGHYNKHCSLNSYRGYYNEV